MNHKEWAARVSECGTEPTDEALQELLADTREAAQDSVGPWHEQQILGMIVMRAEESGDASAAAKECLEHTRGWYKYWRQSLADGLVTAARLAFEAGHVVEGEEYLMEALESVGSRLAFTDRSERAGVVLQAGRDVLGARRRATS